MQEVPFDVLRREREYWKAQLEALTSLVHEALENNNMDLLKNLQAFATTVSLNSIMPMAVLRSLIERTVIERKTRRDLLKAIKTNPEAARNFAEGYSTKEEIDAAMIRFRSDEVIIPIDEFLETEFVDLNRNRCVFFLNELQEKGFLNYHGSDSNPSGMSLPLRLWNSTLERMEREFKEVDFFTEWVGKLLYMGIFREGVQPFKPLAFILGHARENSEGDYDISEEKRIRCYADIGIPANKVRTMDAIDQSKPEEIRFYKKFDGSTRTIYKERKRTYELIQSRAIELLRRRGVRI